MQNENNEKKTVKTVTIVMGSLGLGVVLWGALISLLFVLIPKDHDVSGAKIKKFIDPEEFIYTEESGIEMAKKALRKRYGEEFIVHNVWSEASNKFYVDCSPVSNEEVVFEAALWKDGSGIMFDEYIQGVIARKVSDRFQEELGQIFDDCYVHSAVPPYGVTLKVDNVHDTTIEQYVEKDKEEYGVAGPWVICIFINLEREQEGDVERAYDYFKQVGSELIRKEQTPDIYFDIYGVDEETRNWCENYFSVNATERDEFTSMEAKNPYFSIRYKKGKIKQTFEEYKEYIESRSSSLKEE